MPLCPIANDCAFYTGKTRVTADVIAEARKKFCDATYEKCARYSVFEAAGLDRIPDQLLPHQVGTAEVIIAEGETIQFKAPRKKSTDSNNKPAR